MAGLIGNFKLDNWWKNEFTAEEKIIIENVFKPMSLSGEMAGILTSGNVSGFCKNQFEFLSMLLGWFQKPEYFQIAKKK